MQEEFPKAMHFSDLNKLKDYLQGNILETISHLVFINYLLHLKADHLTTLKVKL